MSADAAAAREIGAALWRIRQRRGERQYKVAMRAGVTNGMLSAYEKGKMCPSLCTLGKILRALDCTAEEFGKNVEAWP